MPPIHIDYDAKEDHDWNGRSSIADVFFRPDIGLIPYPTLNKYLDIMPGHAAELLEIEQCNKADVKEKIYDRLDIFLSCEDIHEEYDFVIIDTAPSKGPLTKSAMRSATDIIIPTQMEDKPIRGVFGMMQLWAQENSTRPNHKPLNLIGILANMFDKRTVLHSSLYEELKANKEVGKYLMPDKLSRRIIFAENDTESASPRSIFDLPNSDKAKQEALAVCKYVFEHVGQEKIIKDYV
jgi:chromosome partitioning protein